MNFTIEPREPEVRVLTLSLTAKYNGAYVHLASELRHKFVGER